MSIFEMQKVRGMLCAPRRFPKFIGADTGQTFIDAFDQDFSQNIAMAGRSSDPNLLSQGVFPGTMAVFIAYLPASSGSISWSKQLNLLNREVKKVIFQQTGSTFLVLISGSPLTILQFNQGGSLQGQVVMSGQTMDQGGFYIDDSGWTNGAYTDTGNGKLYQICRNIQSGSGSKRYQTTTSQEAVYHVEQGIENDDYYVGSRVTDGSGIARTYISLHKYMQVASILCPAYRGWSSTLPTSSHIPQKFMAYEQDSGHAFLKGYAQDPADKSNLLLFYIPQIRGSQTITVAVDFGFPIGVVSQNIGVGLWTPISTGDSKFYTYQVSSEELKALNAKTTSATTMSILMIENINQKLALVQVEFLPLTGQAQTTRIYIDSPVFDLQYLKGAKVESANDFIISGMTSSMASCGISFTGGMGTGFLAKSNSLETCIDFATTTQATIGPNTCSAITWTFQTETYKNPESWSFATSGVSISSPAPTNVNAQQTTCCFHVVGPTSVSIPNYILEDPVVSNPITPFSVLESCTDITLTITYTLVFKFNGTAISAPSAIIFDNSDPNNPILSVQSNTNADVGTYEITLTGKISSGQFTSIIFNVYILSSFAVIAVTIPDYDYIIGSGPQTFTLPQFNPSKPTYHVNYYLTLSDGISPIDPSWVTFSSGSSSTDLIIETADNLKQGVLALMLTGVLQEEATAKDSKIFNINVRNKCFGAKIVLTQPTLPTQDFIITYPSASKSYQIPAWKESTLGQCSEFTYSAMLLPTEEPIPSFMTFDENSRTFTLTQSNFMILAIHTIGVKGILPWGQIDIQTFKVQIGCTVGKISKPDSIPSLPFALGLEYFEYYLPQFTWAPRICKPSFTYKLSMIDSTQQVPKYLSLRSYMQSMDFNGETEIMMFPSLWFDGTKIPDEKMEGIKVLILVTEQSGETQQFLQPITFTLDASDVKVDKEYKIIITNIKSTIKEIGCTDQFDAEFFAQYSSVPCSFNMLKKQGFSLVSEALKTQLSINWDTQEVKVLMPTPDPVNIVALASSQKTVFKYNLFKITFSITLDVSQIPPPNNTTQQINSTNATVVEMSSLDWNLKYPGVPELKAKISSINQMGQVLVEFNQPLSFSDFNTSTIGVKTFSLWIDKTNVKEATNFTWECSSIESDKSIMLQVTFYRPSSISLNNDDYLNVEILDQSIFIPKGFSSDQKRFLESTSQPKRIRMRKLLPRQMKLNQELLSLAVKLKTTITTAVFGNSFINIALSTSLQTVWGMINALQIIILLPLVNLYFPPNAQLIFDILTHIFNFEFYDLTPSLTQLLMMNSFEYQDEISGPLQPQFSNYGYEQLNSVLNLNNVFATLVVILILDSLAMLLALIYRNRPSVPRPITWFDEAVRHNMLARFFLQCFIQLSLCSLLNLNEFMFTSFATSFASVFAAMLIVSLAVFMVYNFRFVRRHDRGELNKEQKKLWESLLEGLNRSRLANIQFNTYYMLRRLFLAFILVFLQDYQNLQMWLFIFQNLIALAYILHRPPFEGHITNLLEVFNEVCITFASYHLLTYSDAFLPEEMEDEGISDLMGWSLTLLVIGQLAVNTLIMLGMSLIGNFKKLILFIRRKCAKNPARKYGSLGNAVGAGLKMDLEMLKTPEVKERVIKSLSVLKGRQREDTASNNNNQTQQDAPRPQLYTAQTTAFQEEENQVDKLMRRRQSVVQPLGLVKEDHSNLLEDFDDITDLSRSPSPGKNALQVEIERQQTFDKATKALRNLKLRKNTWNQGVSSQDLIAPSSPKFDQQETAELEAPPLPQYNTNLKVLSLKIRQQRQQFNNAPMTAEQESEIQARIRRALHAKK
ncbi:hypothetical protein FGO68_gene5798 [Halteria grandinella]|uniref:TRP C-terminal domain-containing protein n=1 Tax=Halteria grandinella TaxID=5974 RepID=A0A8J8P7G7_HALGN|nr:hypothetical protein FGO68_gene5798 [Halteria grandinella]